MSDSFSEQLYRATAELMRTEYAMTERLIGAYAEETGRFPHVVVDHDVGRCWCDGDNDHPPTAADWEQIKRLAAEYREMTNIPASKARLVREFEGTTFSWRWEERK